MIMGSDQWSAMGTVIHFGRIFRQVRIWWTLLSLVPISKRGVTSWSPSLVFQQASTRRQSTDAYPFRYVRSPWQLHATSVNNTGTSLSSNFEAPAIELRAMAYSGLQIKEFQIIKEMVETACWEGIGLSVACTSTSLQWKEESPCLSSRMKGALGRVLLLHTNLDDESIETVQHAISEQMDGLLYSEPPLLTQPVLIKIQNPRLSKWVDTSSGGNEGGLGERLRYLMEQELDMYELNKPIISDTNVKLDTHSRDETTRPTIHVELDAAEVMDAYTSMTWWDTSTVLVFDNLVNDDLRKRLLQVILGSNENNNWNDVQNGPDPKRWVRGGLVDTPSEDQADSVETASMTCWGLRDSVVEEICFDNHAPIAEFEKILTEKVFPQFVVSRLPEAVFGDCVSPLTANAPTYGDHFDYHIDGDPNLTPPSPWTDIYGRYPNRIKGKPRFMSCLLYLNDEWDASAWGAPTRFLDLPTGQSYDVLPKPGRCVIMDQDISHTVVPPNASAGRRPRYSMVWKLILHPQEDQQEMTNLAFDKTWPEPLLFGSANLSAIL